MNRRASENGTPVEFRTSEKKLGLVLSGGGAMGAYQVGVLQALHELGIQVDMVAGASIGALNGAVLSCARHIGEAARQLKAIWIELGRESPLQPNMPAFVRLLGSMGMQPGSLPLLRRLGTLLPVNGGRETEALLESGPIHDLLDRFVTEEKLSAGLPFFVSAFRSCGTSKDLLQGLKAVTGFDTPEAEYFCVQELPLRERRSAILASAALPLLFAPQRIGGQAYVDGGIGGASLSNGNTPAKPLLDAGCSHLIVVHLSTSSVWDRSRCGDAVVLEVAIQKKIGEGGAKDLLQFDEGKAQFLMTRGYQDALASLGKTQAVLELVRNSAAIATGRAAYVARAVNAVQSLLDDDFDRHFNKPLGS